MLVLDEETNNKAWCGKRGRVNKEGLVRVLEKSSIREDSTVD
jgi:hypothetical protein